MFSSPSDRSDLSRDGDRQTDSEDITERERRRRERKERERRDAHRQTQV